MDSIVMGINMVTQELGLLLYPNPSNGSFTIEFLNVKVGVEYIEVVNLLGQQIYLRNIVDAVRTIEVKIEGSVRGVYFVNIATEEGIFTRKLLLY